MPKPLARATLYEWQPQAELWTQCAAVVGTPEHCEREIQHYAMMYGQDGPIKITRRGYRKPKGTNDAK